MKWFAALALAALLVPAAASAQEVLPVGKIHNVDDPSPTVWGISGFEIIPVKRTVGGESPVTRTMRWDARTVEILSRTQAPPLRASDIKHVSKNGREMVVVRRYLLMDVTEADARAEGVSKKSLASKWASSVRRVLPQVAPTPSRFGI
jgi:hypothetical protein